MVVAMIRMSRIPRSSVAGIAATLLALAACAGNAPIPSGAQQVQITVTDEGIELQPESVPAGDVYLVLDGGSISFIERKAGAYASPEPLSDEQIAQIGDGNLQDTSVAGLEANNCDAGSERRRPWDDRAMRQRDARDGPEPGSYLVVAGAPEESGAPSAVLTVTP